MRKNIFTIAIIAIIFVLSSCEKDEVAQSQLNASATKDILTFATQEDFDKTFAKVNAMTKEERLAWEKEQGFKSFGTICDEFYETINPESFKSVEEVKAFVAKNSDKIEFYTSSDGETYCVSKQFNNPKRYLSNKNNEIMIGTAKQLCINTEILEQINDNNLGLYKSTSAIVKSDEIIKDLKVKNDTYRMHIWIDTYNSSNGWETWLVNQVKLTNFARSLGIWWEKTYSTSYKITLVTTDDQWGQMTGGYGSNTITENIKSKNIIYGSFPCAGGTVNTGPRLVSHNIYAKNNTKGVVISSVKTY